MRLLIVALVIFAGCYDPSPADCAYTCPTNTCPDGLDCMNGLCRVPGAAPMCPVDAANGPADAAGVSDGIVIPPTDALIPVDVMIPIGG